MSLDPKFQAASEAAESWLSTVARVAELGRRRGKMAALAYRLLMPDTEGIGPAYRPVPPPTGATLRNLTLRDSYHEYAGVLERMRQELMFETSGPFPWPHGRGGQPVVWSSAHEAALGLAGLAMELLVGLVATANVANRDALARHLLKSRSQSLALSCEQVADLQERIRRERAKLIGHKLLEAETAKQPAKRRTTGRPKNTEKDSATKVIAALSAHHGYELGGSVTNREPAKGRDLAEKYKLSGNALSRFLNDKLGDKVGKGGHRRYKMQCRNGKIGVILADWNRDLAKKLAGLWPEESGREDND